MIVRGFESAANGMMALVENLDNTANNLANVNKVGYKKSSLRFQNIYDSEVVKNTGTLLSGDTRSLGHLSMGSQIERLTYDFTQGTLSRTDNPFDVAVEGDGFFKLQDGEGNITYSRNGSFTRDKDGFLMTKEGDFVLDVRDRRIRIDNQELPLSNVRDLVISENGDIEINNPTGDPKKVQLQKIAIYDFKNKEALFCVGDSRFISRDMTTNPPVLAEKFTLQQGMLEMSNSNVIREMLNTINTTRNYESLSKSVKTSSETLSQAISVGRIKG